MHKEAAGRRDDLKNLPLEQLSRNYYLQVLEGVKSGLKSSRVLASTNPGEVSDEDERVMREYIRIKDEVVSKPENKRFFEEITSRPDWSKPFFRTPKELIHEMRLHSDDLDYCILAGHTPPSRMVVDFAHQGPELK